MLGVCNGFQIITEAGLLPGALVRNAQLRFVCREVKLRVENNQTFYVRVAGERDVDLFNITAGTLLRVTAATVDDQGQRRVKLAIRIEDGAITGQVVDQIPIVQRSTVGTNAMIGEGQSLLIGGYSYEVNRDLNSKLPLLGDIPALGALFTFKNRDVSRAERMFMITPRIIVL